IRDTLGITELASNVVDKIMEVAQTEVTTDVVVEGIAFLDAVEFVIDDSIVLSEIPTEGVVIIGFGDTCDTNLTPGESRLSDWTATVGKTFNTTLAVSLEHDGEYSFSFRGMRDWITDQTDVLIDGNSQFQLVNGFQGKNLNKKFQVQAGIHTIELRNLRAPNEAGVTNGEFILMKTDDLVPTIALEMETGFVADHKEISPIKQFTILSEGQVETVIGPEALSKAFAPILHFNNGEIYDVPMAVDAIFAQMGDDSGSNTGKMDLSMYKRNIGQDIPFSQRENFQPAVYSSFLESDADGEIAINYYFFYPRSNWSEYGGQNTHEGDWEGCTVFLKEVNGVYEPARVAVAQHVEIADGHTSKTDGGDKKDWSELASPDNKLHLYVGLGGHATYFESGETNWPDVNPLDTNGDGDNYNDGLEKHYGDGTYIDTSDFVNYVPRAGELATDHWMAYGGIWGGSNTGGALGLGDTAPSSPMFSSYAIPKDEAGLWWYDPWQWSDDFR
ncbi:MAG: hypothetical protein KAS32_03335, partial [Candidatus Peribacteraceae bacterium]|nr:hypothetical protein [Candidatus Peribacteraceae bacterium]